ncbi:MAG: Protein-export protein SecB [Candidatus Tokpelaia hoelldobleri]|uniref:Protein-export protein SecB n=1 Tax=Candidatus Tokpelaia hoelldobleri TaxID=1902579 RepID=A0A1U9JWR8_9HYPH|nr:MAG: Protein-export protein SecB [Candidatus Tokpelaia hoelldoblerii]
MAKSKKNADTDAAAPVLSILTQYIKDLSFESPNAPQALQAREKAPAININIGVNAASLGKDDYDVTLALDVKAGEDKDLLFNVELIYGGVFKLQNFPQEHITPLLFIECPRLLFPFARQIVADATRNGGFPPLMIDPVDFATLFQRRMAEENAMAQTEGGHA